MNLDLWRKPGALSTPGRRADHFKRLPTGPAALAGVVQGMLMHEHISTTYGIALDGAQHAQAHVRSVEDMLDGIVRRDPRPLTDARAPGERQVGVCRHFTLMHVAMLRAEGVPARARCGFAAYFVKDKFLDHWVTEYWSDDQKRWLLVDAQLDAHQCSLFKVDFDPLDVPRDKFLIAGDAWVLCHRGQADPQAFGILGMFGLWFVASNVIRDAAALNNREMLPWDVWGGMSQTDAGIDVAFIDRVAALTQDPDAHHDDLRLLYSDPRVRVPDTVFNAVLGRPEAVAPLSPLADSP